jgi:hypothetical protein
MLGIKDYVPILKGRQGEYGALQTLSAKAKNAIVPLLELPPIPWDFTEECPAKTIDAHLQDVAEKIEQSWGFDPILIDFLWLSDGDRLSNGEHPAEFVLQTARERNLALIPIIGPTRTDDYIEVIAGTIRQDKRGACIRIQPEDLTDFPDLATTILELLNRAGTGLRDSHLLIDLRSISYDADPDLGLALRFLDLIPSLNEWSSVILSATSFPENLMGIPPSESTPIPRREWQLWRNLWDCSDRPSRMPTFGDYAISHPEPAEVDPRVMRPSASIRYTTSEAWLVLKARNLKDHGFEQFHEVCRNLIEDDQYAGRGFSWGDTYIDDCARVRVGTGNLTTWRRVGTSHHLELVTRQIEDYTGSLESA